MSSIINTIFQFSFQERGKRLRMHQFIVDKAPQLFKAEKKSKDAASSVLRSQDEGNFTIFIFSHALSFEFRSLMFSSG